MKKKSRKLALHRETVAALDQHSLSLAEGGTYPSAGYSSRSLRFAPLLGRR